MSGSLLDITVGRAPSSPVSPVYDFIGSVSRAMVSGRSRSIILSGNVRDLFCNSAGKYTPLVDLLVDKFTFEKGVKIGGDTVLMDVLILDQNNGIRFVNGCEKRVKDMFVSWQIGLAKIEHLPQPKPQPTRDPTFRRRLPTPPAVDSGLLEKRRLSILTALESELRDARNNNGTGLQILRRLVEASQATDGPKLFIIVEGADALVPVGDDLSRMPEKIIRKLAILEEWFEDPAFMDGKSTVVLLSDTQSSINSRVTRIPQVVNIDVPSPDQSARLHYINHLYESRGKKPLDSARLAADTASLSLHAIRQLFVENVDDDQPIPPSVVVKRVEEYIKGELADGVQYKRPTHRLADLRGNRKLKEYFAATLIPRLKNRGNGALPAFLVPGAIRVGKTYIFEAVAAEVGCPVLVLGNIRSMYYGGTDIILDKIERILLSLPKAMVFADEADTLFGGLGSGTHETERRLTGRFQAIMSNPELIGRVTWILMTARVDQLSADIRGEGRAGDLIIPVFDPDDVDRRDFVDDLVAMVDPKEQEGLANLLMTETKGWYAGRFSAVRRSISFIKDSKGLVTSKDILFLVNDLLSPDIADVRRFQELQALLNCTSRQLLPGEYQHGSMDGYRRSWNKEVTQLRNDNRI